MACSRLLLPLMAIAALVMPRVARCEVDWLLKPVSFDGVTTVTSQWTASLDYRPGEVSSSLPSRLPPPPFSWFVRLTEAQLRDITFDSADQQVFLESFRSELERLKLVRTATLAGKEAAIPDVRILVRFDKTEFRSGYRLYVEMTIEGDPGTAQHWRYVADSTVRAPLDTEVPRAKSRAASALLHDMIPDVEAWIRENLPADGLTGASRKP
jgi:hypothetical protein